MPHRRGGYVDAKAIRIRTLLTAAASGESPKRGRTSSQARPCRRTMCSTGSRLLPTVRSSGGPVKPAGRLPAALDPRLVRTRTRRGARAHLIGPRRMPGRATAVHHAVCDCTVTGTPVQVNRDDRPGHESGCRDVGSGLSRGPSRGSNTEDPHRALDPTDAPAPFRGACAGDRPGAAPTGDRVRVGEQRLQLDLRTAAL